MLLPRAASLGPLGRIFYSQWGPGPPGPLLFSVFCFSKRPPARHPEAARPPTDPEIKSARPCWLVVLVARWWGTRGHRECDNTLARRGWATLHFDALLRLFSLSRPPMCVCYDLVSGACGPPRPPRRRRAAARRRPEPPLPCFLSFKSPARSRSPWHECVREGAPVPVAGGPSSRGVSEGGGLCRPTI